MNQTSIDPTIILNQNYRRELPAFFQLPETQSQFYRKKISAIFQSFDGIQQFTKKLEDKVDNLLRLQQNEFVTSYQSHMSKVQNQFHKLQGKVKEQQNQINYYENEGKMSQLVKKVHILESQSKRLYLVIEKKQKIIKDLLLENKVQREQTKRVTGQVKELMRNRMTSNILKLGLNNLEDVNKQQKEQKEPKQSAQKFFTTELQNQKSIKGQLSRTTDENKIGFTYHLSQKTPQYGSVSKDYYQKKQISNLKIKNRKLISFTSKIYDDRNQLQNIFSDCVREIKKQVKIRKKIRQCSYEDFRKQDKLNLLVLFITNDQMLRIIYQKMFQKKKVHLYTLQEQKQKEKRKNEILPNLTAK